METEPLVEVYRGHHLIADIIRGMLQTNGIRVSLIGPGTSSAYPLSVGDLGEGRVLVFASDENVARELIATEVDTIAEDATEGPDDPDERGSRDG